MGKKKSPIAARLGMGLLTLSLFGAVFGCSDDNATVPYINLTTGQAMAVVIGQADFTGQTANRGGAAGRNTTNFPYGNPAVVDGILYLPDSVNNRVLGYNGVPATNGADADFVLGQADFVSNGFAITATTMNSPQTVFEYEGKLFVASWGNSRVLIYNTPPTTTGAAADLVVGAPDLNTYSGACSQSTTSNVESAHAAGGKLFVADSANNRVLIWNSIPTTDGAPADVVLGQDAFDECLPNDVNHNGIADDGGALDASTLFYPAGIWSDGTRLIVADTENIRVLIWNSIPTTNAAPADVVLGQPDMVTTAAATTDRDMGFPTHLHSNGTQLFVADSSNARVLVWNRIPGADYQAADVVLGQADFTKFLIDDANTDGIWNETNPGAGGMDWPAGVLAHGSQLFVTGGGNHRYMIFNGL